MAEVLLVDDAAQAPSTTVKQRSLPSKGLDFAKTAMVTLCDALMAASKRVDELPSSLDPDDPVQSILARLLADVDKLPQARSKSPPRKRQAFKSGYNIFLQEVASSRVRGGAGETPETPVPPIMKQCADLWKELSDAEKQTYNDRAAIEKQMKLDAAHLGDGAAVTTGKRLRQEGEGGGEDEGGGDSRDRGAGGQQKAQKSATN